MIGHYLASALTRFRRSPFTTAANVLTLALGLACFIGAYGIAAYWRSGDSHHPGAERLVYVEQIVDGEPFGSDGVTSATRLAFELRQEMPELEAVGRINGNGSSSRLQVPVQAGAATAYLQFAGADQDVFDVLAFNFVEGAAATALSDSSAIVLTQPAARQLFGDEPALGKSVVVGGRDRTVSGVITLMRQPSFLGHSSASPVTFDGLSALSPDVPESWRIFGAMTLVRLPPAMSVADFQARLDDLVERKVEKQASGEPAFLLRAVPVQEITRRIIDRQFLSRANAGLSASGVLLALGALILLVAGVNYANLAMAQAGARLKESGMRRTLGAGRRALLGQYVVEAGLQAAPALLLALLVVTAAAPVFRNALGVEVTYFLSAGPGAVAFLVAVALASAALAGAYPALAVTRVRPSDALGGGARQPSRTRVSRILVIVQFFSATVLLIVLVVTQLQYAHLRSDPSLARGAQIMVLDSIPGAAADEPGEARAAKFAAFAAELSRLPQVHAVATTSETPWIDDGGQYYDGLVGSSDAAAAKAATMVWSRRVAGDFFAVFGRQLLAGRFLDPGRDRSSGQSLGAPGSEPAPAVIDRRLAEALGYTDPQGAVGRTLYLPWAPEGVATSTTPLVDVIGVVEADRWGLESRDVAGVFYTLDLDYGEASQPAIRIDGADIAGALPAIEGVWREFAPEVPFRVRFIDQLFEEAYAPYHTIAATFIVLSACALLISTAGLVGIVVHAAARRRHEIGVRKVLGASTPRVLRMLLVDFSRPVIIGNVLAWPLAWMAAQTYLANFAERAPLTPLPFVLSLIFTLLVAWASVGGQAWKAARVKPALVLKAE